MRKFVPFIVGGVGWFLTVLALGLLFSGCASRIDRTIEGAINTPWQEAGYTPVPGNNAAPIFEKLKIAARVLGIEILSESPDEQNAGEAWQDENGNWFVTLDKRLDANGSAETLAHELAHTVAPPELHLNPAAEMFAELVMVEVLAKFGYDASATSSRYLGKYKAGLVFAPVYAKDIKAAAILLYEASQH